MIASAAQAAPRAESAMECGIAADMAVVAHSLAQEHIQRPQADAIMVRIYDVSSSDRGKQLMRDIMDAAYRANDGGIIAPSASSGGTGAQASGQKFAEDLFATCMKTGGNMDGMLGRRS
jgi:lipopolysaccharide export LptBFGC system permease protein LptF